MMILKIKVNTKLKKIKNKTIKINLYNNKINKFLKIINNHKIIILKKT